MTEPALRLFKVECRGTEGVITHFFVPAISPHAAVVEAMGTVRRAQTVDPEIIDPFQEIGSEVRVGTFESGASSNIIFGDWSRPKN